MVPGPGSYELKGDVYMRPRTMATFGKCTSDRVIFKSNTNPGPGQYSYMLNTSPLANDQSFMRDVFDDERMASFKSDTKLKYQQAGHTS